MDGTSREPEMPRSAAAVRSLLLLTAVVTLAYWAAVFSGFFRIESALPGFDAWFMSFPLADLWIAVAALASLHLWNRNSALSAIFTAATGSAMIFLALNGFWFGWRAGTLLDATVDNGIELAIKMYCVAAGSLFIWAGYRRISGG